MLAACGCYVPMISGRGLGHTGGTLDKLDSIPGYKTQPGLELFRKAVTTTGAAIIGQTADLAPADKRLYAIRDVTATVESIPLITASILSKKLAAGLDTLVLDVKTGSGAFMAKEKDARALAQTLVDVANGAGLKTTALLTAMDEPLASAAGNAVEVLNAVHFLTGAQRDQRLLDVTLELGAELLVTAKVTKGKVAALALLSAALDKGEAAERFQRMVTVLGGPKDFVMSPEKHLPKAAIIRPVFAETFGKVTSIDTRAIGLAVIALGGGRRMPADNIDHAVGFTALAGKGATLDGTTPIAILHANDAAKADAAAVMLQAAYRTGRAPKATPTIRDRIGPSAK